MFIERENTQMLLHGFASFACVSLCLTVHHYCFDYRAPAIPERKSMRFMTILQRSLSHLRKAAKPQASRKQAPSRTIGGSLLGKMKIQRPALDS